MHNSMFYNNFYPYQAMNMGKTGILKNGLLGGISKVNWSNLLTNTQKTLNVINQAIPVYYQVKPIYNNAKTMFKVMGAFKEQNNNNSNNNNQSNNDTININKNTNQNRPVFFT